MKDDRLKNDDISYFSIKDNKDPINHKNNGNKIQIIHYC